MCCTISFYSIILFFALFDLTAQIRNNLGVELGADSTKVTDNTYAIIIGISEYKLVPTLQYAHKDAQAFEYFLLSDAGGKIPKANIETFLNKNASSNSVFYS